MYRGYVKLWRKLEDSDIFKNEKALKIWIWILIKANHQERTVLFGRRKIVVNPGEFIMGLNKASEHLDLAKSTIHFWVNYLNDLQMVELKKTNKYTLIKVKNWGDYQGGETQTELQKNSKRTLKETNNNVQQCSNIKNTPIGAKQKNMYKEPTIEIDDLGEEIKHPVKPKTFGRYPARIAMHYCNLMGKTSAGRQLPASKELMLIAQREYPNESLDVLFNEIVGRIDLAKKYYTKNNVKEWNLSKVAENWNKILTVWIKEVEL